MIIKNDKVYDFNLGNLSFGKLSPKVINGSFWYRPA